MQEGLVTDMESVAYKGNLSSDDESQDEGWSICISITSHIRLVH
jgi:hypothetical protein